jgi:5-methylcytosine-specific restriction enzyme A
MSRRRTSRNLVVTVGKDVEPTPEQLADEQDGKIMILRLGRVNAEGRKLCKVCQQPVPKGRREWCGDGCVTRYFEFSGTFLRQAVFKRDKGICALCGTDAKLTKVVMRVVCKKLGWGHHSIGRELFHQYLNEWLGVAGYRANLWDVDHIVPFSKGGTHKLSNLRTLCCKCHKRETARLRQLGDAYVANGLTNSSNEVV